MFFSVCKLNIILVYIASIYILASLYYLIYTKSYFKTPLNDIINNSPKLKELKDKSVNKRKKVFYFGIVVGTFIMVYLRPFKSCYNEVVRKEYSNYSNDTNYSSNY